MSENIFINKSQSRNYTILDNRFLRDSSLSMQEKGLLAYLLSLPPHWQIRRIELMRHFTNGQTAIDTAIQKLIQKGYITREQKRTHKYKFSTCIYSVFEFPQKQLNTPMIPASGKSQHAKPEYETSHSPTPTVINTNNRKSTISITHQDNPFKSLSLKQELRKHGWVGDFARLIEDCGSIEALEWQWTQIKPCLVSVSEACRGGFITNELLDTREIYSLYQADQNMRKKQKEVAKIELQMMEEQQKEKEAQLLHCGKSQWDQMSLHERLEYVEEYCSKNPIVASTIRKGFDLAAIKFINATAEAIIISELASGMIQSLNEDAEHS